MVLGISTCLSLKDRGGAISAAKGGSKGSKSRKSVPYPPEKDGVLAGMGFTKWMRFHIDLTSNLRIDDLTSNLRIEKMSQK